MVSGARPTKISPVRGITPMDQERDENGSGEALSPIASHCREDPEKGHGARPGSGRRPGSSVVATPPIKLQSSRSQSDPIRPEDAKEPRDVR